MRKTTITAAVLSLGLVVAGCSGDEENGAAEETNGTAQEQTTEGGQGNGEETTEGTPEAMACAGFFEEGGNTLADRAEEARQTLSNDEVTDGVSYSPVSLLEQRIRALASESPNEIASLLEQVNTPFQAAVTAVNENAQDRETGESDRGENSVEESEIAQQELQPTCN